MAVFLPALLVLSQITSTAAAAVKVDATKDTPIVRRHTSVEVSPSGALTQTKPAAKARDENSCYSFADGVQDKSECTDPTHHKLIYSAPLCEQAANETGLPLASVFPVPTNDADVYPKGCFKTSDGCAGGATECINFNLDGDMPTAPVGLPVCTDPRHLFGTNDTNGDAANDDCHQSKGYETITTEDACSAAGACMGDCEGGDFVIGLGGDNGVNLTEYNAHPHGCFIDTSNKDGKAHCVYWNPGSTHHPYDLNTTLAVPTAPVGRPLCRQPDVVTTVTDAP